MDLYHFGLLIRALMALGMICVFVIAGMLVGRRNNRGASSLNGDATKTRRQFVVVSRFPGPDRGPLEATHSEASAPSTHRRAA